MWCVQPVSTTGRRQHSPLCGIAVKRSRKQRRGPVYTVDWCLELSILGHLQKSSEKHLALEGSAAQGSSDNDVTGKQGPKGKGEPVCPSAQNMLKADNPSLP